MDIALGILIFYIILGCCNYIGMLWGWAQGLQIIENHITTALLCIFIWPYVVYQALIGLRKSEHSYLTKRPKNDNMDKSNAEDY